MPPGLQTPEGPCFDCGAELVPAERHCPTCKADAGAPNVRQCHTSENIKALADRYDTAREQASRAGCLREFEALENILKQKSGVVVSMSPGVARGLLEDPRKLYSNYEQLVGAHVRKPSATEDDRTRCAVGGQLFGSYADHIIYGALSLTESGLATYGEVYCRLRDSAVAKRTSFLETNSYRFVQMHQLTAGGKIHEGSIGCWLQRHQLALAKVVDSLRLGQVESVWQDILICSDGKNRAKDEFIEAHTYEGFDRNAIESLVPASGVHLSRNEQLDLDVAMDVFRSHRGQVK